MYRFSMDSDLPKPIDACALRTLQQDTNVSPALAGFIKLLARIAVEKQLAALHEKATPSEGTASPQSGGEGKDFAAFHP